MILELIWIYVNIYICLFACCGRCVLLADEVNEPENEDVGGEYREFDTEDLNFQ
jgi:hypothetical protein